MGVFQNNLMGAAAAAASGGATGFYTHQIVNSLRFNKADSSFLTMTPSAGGDQKTWAISFWAKRCGLGLGSWGNEACMAWDDGASGGAYSNIISWHRTGDKLNMGTGYSYTLHTTQSYRDTSAWYHIVILADTTQAVAANRWKMYTNGVQIESFDDETLPPQDYDFPNVAKSAVYIGKAGGSAYSAGSANLYLAEMAFVEGTAYAIGDFGETKNGVWIPKDVSGLTFGDEGWYLKFESSSDLGNDSSGNNNDFTLTNIAADNQTLDSPTFGSEGSANFAAWSPLIKGANNLSEGNVRFDGTGDSKGAITSWAIPTATKYYVEALIKIQTNYNFTFGIANPQFNPDANDEDDATMNGMLFRAQSAGDWNTCSLTNGSRGSFSSDVGQTATRVLGMTVNRVDNEIKMYLDNSLLYTISISATEVYHIVTSHAGGAQAANHNNINAGQDSTGAGDFSANTATDENGFGNFQHAPPSGFLAFCSANLPTADAVDPAETDDDFTQELFFMSQYAGNLSGRTITTENQPDLMFIRSYNGAQNWYVLDSTRVITDNKYVLTNDDAAEATLPQSNITSVGATSVGISSGTWLNSTGSNYQMWMWRANAGTTASNSNGSITSTVQVDPSSGFSIVSYTGADSTWDNMSTVGHGLSSAPDCILLKPLTHIPWEVFFSDLGGTGGGSTAAGNSLVLNSTAALYTNQTYRTWGDVMPTSTVFTVNGNNANAASVAMIAYCFANTEGYIKSGSYEGNGDADGTFVYCGFRPAFIMTKSLDSTSDWQMFDDKRLGYNDDNNEMQLNETDAEVTTDMIDILSNGFKFKIATDPNVAETYVYLAVAYNPFQYATAR